MRNFIREMTRNLLLLPVFLLVAALIIGFGAVIPSLLAEYYAYHTHTWWMLTTTIVYCILDILAIITYTEGSWRL